MFIHTSLDNRRAQSCGLVAGRKENRRMPMQKECKQRSINRPSAQTFSRDLTSSFHRDGAATRRLGLQQGVLGTGPRPVMHGAIFDDIFK